LNLGIESAEDHPSDFLVNFHLDQGAELNWQVGITQSGIYGFSLSGAFDTL
jgi:hypothetical protein